MVKPTLIHSVDELCPEFDLFLFDQYGVLHNGQDSYAGMIDCVSGIKALGKQVGVISNSGKRANYNAQRLAQFGFDSSLVDAVVTSGEVAWSNLNDSLAHAEQALRVLYVGAGTDRSAIAGLRVIETRDSADADLIIINGSEPERYSLDDYVKILNSAAQKNTQAYCTNPDKWILAGNDLQYGPGQIADNYQAAGGRVQWIGKPYAAIYSFALDMFDVSANRVVCIGDSIEHDIAGARAAGLASVLTATGILGDMDRAELESLYQRYGATPSYIIWRP